MRVIRILRATALFVATRLRRRRSWKSGTGLYVANPAHTMNTTSLCCLLTLLLAIPAAAAEGDGISWSIISYVWAIDTKVDLKADAILFCKSQN